MHERNMNPIRPIALRLQSLTTFVERRKTPEPDIRQYKVEYLRSNSGC